MKVLLVGGPCDGREANSETDRGVNVAVVVAEDCGAVYADHVRRVPHPMWDDRVLYERYDKAKGEWVPKMSPIRTATYLADGRKTEDGKPVFVFAALSEPVQDSGFAPY